MKKLLLILALTFASFSVHAQTVPGMKYTQGIVCTNPFVAKDLMDVIHNKEMFQGWEQGYITTGYCSPVNLGKSSSFELKLKLISGVVSHDGYKAELWQVMMEVEEGQFKPFYAIIFPEASNTVGGDRL